MQTMQEKDQVIFQECIRYLSLAQSPQTMCKIVQEEGETTADPTQRCMSFLSLRFGNYLTHLPKEHFVFWILPDYSLEEHKNI